MIEDRQGLRSKAPDEGDISIEHLIYSHRRQSGSSLRAALHIADKVRDFRRGRVHFNAVDELTKVRSVGQGAVPNLCNGR